MSFEPDADIVENYREIADQTGQSFDEIADGLEKTHGPIALAGYLRSLDKAPAKSADPDDAPQPEKPGKRTATPPAKRTAAATSE